MHELAGSRPIRRTRAHSPAPALAKVREPVDEVVYRGGCSAARGVEQNGLMRKEVIQRLLGGSMCGEHGHCGPLSLCVRADHLHLMSVCAGAVQSSLMSARTRAANSLR